VSGVDTAPGGDLQTMERVMIEQALKHAHFDKSKAAKALASSNPPKWVLDDFVTFDRMLFDCCEVPAP
jgi:hypothetical protein